METEDETNPNLASEETDIKAFAAPMIMGSPVHEITDAMELLEDARSVCQMKKIYSIERMGFEDSSTAVDAQTKSNERLVQNRLYRASSSTLEQPQTVSKISLGVDPRTKRSGNDLFLLDVLDMKKFALANYIQANPKAADLKWSLFCAACHSYRYDSVLRPFPPMFLIDEIKDIDKLREVTESCPSINVLYEQMQERTSPLLTPDLINLLYWVLIHVREPQLKLVPKDLHSTVLSKVTSTPVSAMPKYIFQVTYARQTDHQQFNDLAAKYRIIHAFHGSRLDNFYSILNYGLLISFTKMSQYGPGIYLSSEVNVSLPYSQSGFSWGGSFFGSQISIVALCEMIDHPDVKHPNNETLANKKRKKFMTDFDSVPEKYFIVQNSDLVRVKYLLIYCNNYQQTSSTQLSTVISWFQKNKVVAVVLAYVILLMAIATSNNSTVYKYYKRMARRLRIDTLRL